MQLLCKWDYFYHYLIRKRVLNTFLSTHRYTSDVTCTSLYQRLDADIINSCIADSTASSFKVTYPTKYNWQSTASCTGSYNSTNTYPSNCVMVAGSNPALYGNSEVILTPAFAPTSAPISNSNDDDASLKGGEIAAVVICLLIFAGKKTWT